MLYNIYTLNELVQGRVKEGKRSFTFSESIRNSLAEWFIVKIVGAWCAAEDVESLLGVQCYWMGRSQRCLMWSKGLPKDVVYLQFCFLYNIHNGLLVAVEQARLGKGLSDGGQVGGLLFADDFVWVQSFHQCTVYGDLLHIL